VISVISWPAALLLALALCVPPARPALRIGQRSAPMTQAALRPLVGIGGVVAVLAVLATDRATLLLSVCVAGATAIHSVVAARRRRAHHDRAVAAAGYLGHLVAALRAGSSVAEACARAAEQTADNAPADLASELRRVAAHTRSGGSGAAILAASPLPELRDVGVLWGLSAKLGIPVADLLGSARSRLDNAVRHRNATTAALAGPRATAVVLSVLPLAGILMGQAMGARPVALLTGGGLGGLLLLVGTALVCAGFATSQAIIGRAAG